MRHLLVAAALRESLPDEVIVVGGTAEEYWTSDEYHETDLDVCTPLDRAGAHVLRALGFRKQGRHWTHPNVAVAVEIPDSAIDGDPSRCVLETVPGGGSARIIGVDDLYIDRLRQATISEGVEGLHFHSALAIAAACFETIDWRYIRARIQRMERSEPGVGGAMKRINRALRSRAARAARP